MKGKKQKEPVGFNPAEIFAALALLEKERGIPQSFMMGEDHPGPDHRLQAGPRGRGERDRGRG